DVQREEDEVDREYAQRQPDPPPRGPGGLDPHGEPDGRERGAGQDRRPGDEEPQCEQLHPAELSGRHARRRRHEPAAAPVFGVDEAAGDQGDQERGRQRETGTEAQQQRVPRRVGDTVEVGGGGPRAESGAGDDDGEGGGQQPHLQMAHLGELGDQRTTDHSAPPAVRCMNTLSNVCSSRRTPCTPISSPTRLLTMPATSSSLSTPGSRTVPFSRRAPPSPGRCAPWAASRAACARRGSEASMSRSGVAAENRSRRVPWKINLPWLRMPRTVAVLSISPSRCEDTITVTPPSASCRRSSRISSMPAGSSPLVGSSRI